MEDVLKYLKIKARVFQSGSFCRSASYVDPEGMGYLHILQQGSVEVDSPAHSPLLLSEPSLFFYTRCFEHRMASKSENTVMVCASFSFGAGSGNPILQAFPEFVCLPLRQLAGVEQLLSALFQEAASGHSGRQAILDRLMEVVFIRVLGELQAQNLVEQGLIAGLSDKRLSKAITCLHAEPAHHWSVQELATVAGMSRARFADYFHRVVGVTPGAYLLQWRMGLTQVLLLEGKPVQLIASEVGYGSASALSRVFKQHQGLTPTQWFEQASKT